MKKISISLLIMIAGVVLSCGKEDDIVDCFGQSLLLNVHHRTDVDNSKKLTSM